MKLLVLAQTPPPHHGQSAMVQLMLDELPGVAPDIELHHVNLALSTTGAEIGRWQPGKLLALRRVLRTARATVERRGCDALYYVPAPGKRIALWRDLMVMRSLRSAVPRLVLHWHASGLGAWLDAHAMGWEKRAAHRALGQADLSIALASALVTDVAKFNPRNTAIVANGIPDPLIRAQPPARPAPEAAASCRILFLGAGSEAKGLFRSIAALAHLPATSTLTFAGAFANPEDAQRFASAQAKWGTRLTHAGFANAAERRQLLLTHDVLAFPTQYPHEAFPLVLIEALAADLPIVTTRWRAIPDLLPSDFGFYTAPDDAGDLAKQIQAAVAAPPQGRYRAYYQNHYTATRFAANLATSLRTLN